MSNFTTPQSLRSSSLHTLLVTRSSCPISPVEWARSGAGKVQADGPPCSLSVSIRQGRGTQHGAAEEKVTPADDTHRSGLRTDASTGKRESRSGGRGGGVGILSLLSRAPTRHLPLGSASPILGSEIPDPHWPAPSLPAPPDLRPRPSTPSPRQSVARPRPAPGHFLPDRAPTDRPLHRVRPLAVPRPRGPPRSPGPWPRGPRRSRSPPRLQVHPAPRPACRALLSDRSSAALVVLGFLSLPPLFVLASAARARLARRLRSLLPPPTWTPGPRHHPDGQEQLCAWV